MDIADEVISGEPGGGVLYHCPKCKRYYYFTDIPLEDRYVSDEEALVTVLRESSCDQCCATCPP
jgi:hypothetical protein